jgi:hypothetical protein
LKRILKKKQMSEVREKKQKNDDKTETVTAASALPPANKEPTIGGPLAVTYLPQLDIELVDNKLLSSLPMLQCWGCQSLVWNCEVPPCVHLACKGCLDTWFLTRGEDAGCPTCKKPFVRSDCVPLSSTNPSHVFITRALASLKIKCPEYSHVGCKAVMDYSEAKEHLNKTCSYSTTVCEFCKGRFKICEFEQHGKACRRWITCKACKSKHLESETDMHAKVCPRMLIDCPNICGTKIVRAHVATHLQTCPEEKLPCPIPGCPVRQVVRRAFTGHVNDLSIHPIANTDPNTVMKCLCKTAGELELIKEVAHKLPIAFCEKKHLMRYTVASVYNGDDRPTCSKCAEEMEARETHYACPVCDEFVCGSCMARQVVLEDGLSRGEQWAVNGERPPMPGYTIQRPVPANLPANQPINQPPIHQPANQLANHAQQPHPVVQHGAHGAPIISGRFADFLRVVHALNSINGLGGNVRIVSRPPNTNPPHPPNPPNPPHPPPQ